MHDFENAGRSHPFPSTPRPREPIFASNGKPGAPAGRAGRPDSGRTSGGAGRVTRRCPRHREPAECERVASQIIANASFRTELVLALEDVIWRRARVEIAERVLAEHVSMFEVADCWRFGDPIAPSLERSVFLWHAQLGDATLATRAEPVLALRCPAEEELFRAQQDALVIAAANRGGIFLRDALFERPDIRFRDDWPNRFTAFARPADRFLLRLPVFRGVPLLDEIGISHIVLADVDMEKLRELLQETGLTPATPGWGWHIAAMWTAVATDDWAATELGARRATTTRH